MCFEGSQCASRCTSQSKHCWAGVFWLKCFYLHQLWWSVINPPKEMIQSGPWRLSLEKNRISWSSSPAPARPQFWRRKWLFSRQACPSGTYSAEVLDSKGSTFACSWVETCWNMLKYRELGPPLISDRGTTWYLSHSNFNGKYMGPSNKLWNA
jgi:hypothetical protein